MVYSEKAKNKNSDSWYTMSTCVTKSKQLCSIWCLCSFLFLSSFQGRACCITFPETKKGGKCNQKKNVPSFYKAFYKFNRTIQMSHFATLIYTATWGCFLLCEVIIINPSLINQMQVSIDLYLCEAAGCFLSASGKGECMLDQTQLPARSCHRDL